MGDNVNTATAWIRPEDADHPKLERLRRALTVTIGPDGDVSIPWVVWGNSLSRGWLSEKLEVGAQVLIFPPWPEGGFAGLPAIRIFSPPSNALSLQGKDYSVGAICAIEPTPAWQEHGLFSNTKLAWLVAHEPFVGAGRAWLCTAELLVTSPTTRPREMRRLITDLIAYLTSLCRKKQVAHARGVKENEQLPDRFSRDDVPYLLAVLGWTGTVDTEKMAQFVYRRLGIEPDIERVRHVLAQPDVQEELSRPIGSRTQLAKFVDDFGFRSYRIEIEETAL